MARSDDYEELGRNRGNESSDDHDEESGKSGDEPKEMPLERAEQPSSPSLEDAGAQGSGEVSPARSAPRGGVAMMTKNTTSKQLKQKQTPPASPEEGEAEDSGGASPVAPKDSGDASPARGPLPDDSADAGHRSAATPRRGEKRGHKSAATPRRGEKRSPPPRQEEERLNKKKKNKKSAAAAAVGPDAETVAASAPQRKNKNKKSADKDRRKKKQKKQLKKALIKTTSKKKKHLKKASTKPTSPPQFLESELNANREDTPSSPDIAQEDEHHGREKAEQEPSNTSPPRDEYRAREEEQKEMAEQEEHARDTSPPHDKDMHCAHGEEQQEKEVANQEHEEDNLSADEEEQLEVVVPQQEQPMDTSPMETGAQALHGRNAPSTKPRGSGTEKKPTLERSWSYDDELKILNALVAHAQSHDGALPDPSHLLANITFDKFDANEEKLTDKIRKLKTRYRRFRTQGCPSDVLSRRLFKLSETLWGQVAEDVQVEPTSSRDFSVLSKLYPYLAQEVKVYAQAHSSGNLIMAKFMTIGDAKARDLDAKCKKQQIEALKFELGQAGLINELLSALSSLPL